MPTPERTNVAEIIAAAQELLEASGVAGLTMAAVAHRVGVRAPSLYKRVGGRDELLGRVAVATVLDLGSRLEAAAGVGASHHDAATARAALTRLGRAYRAFAKERPAAYQLIFAQEPAAARPQPEHLSRAAAPALAVTEALVGPERALDAARLVTAWVHGFMSMELSGAFRLGGDVERAFEYGLAALSETLGR
ncbi:TetR/AcrR family transcriptional regulator [Sinomonas notoginsengisoli]|uniref:TetR/AcrR family transcriptional regulator n=1 Tax=Sinomonas notoginsengisoli TaxID=1457311 RepID=UPI001F3A6029|nr:TetR/AcrR family transcriptional regulator [Sinomonas notoginsengisoli]